MYSNKGLYTSHIVNKEHCVTADFEDMFLFDGKRQLKIRYNPKISSFKTTKLETKVDTIGSQYPHFFSNAHVKYKEFPISGLISILSDEDQLFFTQEESFTTRVHTPMNPEISYKNNSTSLTTENIVSERLFKM